jgi:hypothetical protein
MKFIFPSSRASWQGCAMLSREIELRPQTRQRLKKMLKVSGSNIGNIS